MRLGSYKPMTFRSWVVDNSVAGDVHVRGDYPGFTARFFEENEINLETMPEDDEILKNGTVDFSRIRKDSFY